MAHLRRMRYRGIVASARCLDSRTGHWLLTCVVASRWYGGRISSRSCGSRGWVHLPSSGVGISSRSRIVAVVVVLFTQVARVVVEYGVVGFALARSPCWAAHASLLRPGVHCVGWMLLMFHGTWVVVSVRSSVDVLLPIVVCVVA